MNDQKDKKKSLERKVQDFLASYRGKIMLNYAYSWGAAIVILGALFKLTHLPGANIMLFVGMGTEVLVFFISAFDRPYKSYKWESVFPKIKISGVDYSKEEKNEEDTASQEDPMSTVLNAQEGQQQFGNGPIIIGGGGYMPAAASGSPAPVADNGSAPAAPMTGASGIQGGVIPTIVSVPTGGAVTPGVEVTPEMEDATKAYLEQLKEMTEALTSFVEQTKSMGQDAEQINTLNKNLTGINAIYEIQLRSISSQLSTIDEINAQSRKMAQQIDELNAVYARMLEAMTVNMK